MEAYFRDVVLVEQKWVREQNVTIADLINDVAAKTKEKIHVRRFARFHMGLT
jgi:elongation factor Ts